MNHHQVWWSTQTADVTIMASDDLVHQPFSSYHPGPRKSSQELRDSSFFNGLSVHTQPMHHHGSLCVGGLPSPAPSGRAASPPDGPNHDTMPVNGSWVPISPMSPAPCEGEDRELNYAQEIPPCVSTLVASHSNATGLYGWDEFNLPYEFEHTCWDVSKADFAADAPLGIFAVPVPWAGHIQPTSFPDELLLLPEFGHLVPTIPAADLNQAGFNHPNLPATQRTPLSQPQQSPPQTEPLLTHTPISTKPASSSPERSPSLPNQPHHPSTVPSSGGPTLRTAPRRINRPSPSAITKPGESPEHQRARATHNLVEQLYRRRLHAQYQALLEVLPPEGMLEEEDTDGGKVRSTKSGSHSNPSGNGSGHSKRMSKVDVLHRAARVVRFLERDIDRTRREVEGLKREREAAVDGGRSIAQTAYNGEGENMRSA